MRSWAAVAPEYTYRCTMSKQSGTLCQARDGGAATRRAAAAAVVHRDTMSEQRGYAVFQGTSNGGRQFLRNRRSNRYIVPLYGKSDCPFPQGLKFETR